MKKDQRFLNWKTRPKTNKNNEDTRKVTGKTMPGGKGKTRTECMDNGDDSTKMAMTDNIIPKSNRHVDFVDRIKKFYENTLRGTISRFSWKLPRKAKKYTLPNASSFFSRR